MHAWGRLSDLHLYRHPNSPSFNFHNFVAYGHIVKYFGKEKGRVLYMRRILRFHHPKELNITYTVQCWLRWAPFKANIVIVCTLVSDYWLAIYSYIITIHTSNRIHFSSSTYAMVFSWAQNLPKYFTLDKQTENPGQFFTFTVNVS